MVSYTVTNQSSKSKNLKLKTTAGLSASSCHLAGKGSTCILDLTVNGNAVPSEGIHAGPILCEEGNPNQCYQPSAANRLSVTLNPELSASVSDLTLGVSGQSRIIIITNSSDSPTTNLSLSYPSWPTDTNTTGSTCVNGGTIAARNGTCTIVINPGPNATSGANNAACTTGTAPIPGVIKISANGSTPVTINAIVLGYGCQYQGGFVFSIDDSTPTTSSIGGKVAALADQATIVWDADPVCSTYPNECTNQTNAWDFNIGLNRVSVPGSTNPGNSDTNGPGDTYQISSILNGAHGNTNTSPATYAAGVCISYNDGTYADWYLPAICEMGPDSGHAICNTTTVEQNMVDNLPLLLSASCSDTKCLSGYYWSSTEDSGNPQYGAWGEHFNFSPSVGSFQSLAGKFGQSLVRCVRAFK